MASIEQICFGVVHRADGIAVPDNHSIRHAHADGYRLASRIHGERALIQARQGSGQGHGVCIHKVPGHQVVPTHQRVCPFGHVAVNIQAYFCIRAQRQVGHRQDGSGRTQGGSVNGQGGGIQSSRHILGSQSGYFGGRGVQRSSQSRIRIQIQVGTGQIQRSGKSGDISSQRQGSGAVSGGHCQRSRSGQTASHPQAVTAADRGRSGAGRFYGYQAVESHGSGRPGKNVQPRGGIGPFQGNISIQGNSV